jgi:excisionase family DNA binding protein
MIITIPAKRNPGIQIPARPVEPKPESKRRENIERIGVSIQEAAKMLGVDRKTFLPLIKEGTVRIVRLGRRVLVSVQSLRDFVDGKKETL